MTSHLKSIKKILNLPIDSKVIHDIMMISIISTNKIKHTSIVKDQRA